MVYKSDLNIKHWNRSNLYWGIYNPTNQPILIDEVQANGLACDCRCAACGEALEAHLGKIQKPHFQHYANNDCVYGNEIAKYQLFHRLLVKGGTVRLPAVMVMIGHKPQPIQPAREAAIGNVHYEYSPNHYPPLLIAQLDNQPTRIILNIDDYYTADDRWKFHEEARNNGWDCLVFHLDSSEPMTEEILHDFSYAGRQWICSTLGDAWESKLEAVAVTPREFRSVTGYLVTYLYECPLHLFEHGGIYYARKQDCQQCPYNLSMTAKCRCMAPAGIKTLADFDSPEEVRLAEVMHIRQEHDERRAKQRAESAAQTVAQTPTKKVSRADNEARYQAGYEDVKDRSPQSQKPVSDHFGTQWHYCTECNQWVPQPKMAAFGGVSGPVKGICKACHKKRIQAAMQKWGTNTYT